MRSTNPPNYRFVYFDYLIYFWIFVVCTIQKFEYVLLHAIFAVLQKQIEHYFNPNFSGIMQKNELSQQNSWNLELIHLTHIHQKLHTKSFCII